MFEKLRQKREDLRIIETHKSLSPEIEGMAWFFRSLGSVAFVGGTDGLSPGSTASLDQHVAGMPGGQLMDELEWDFNRLRSELDLSDEEISEAAQVAADPHYNPSRYQELMSGS